ncbi:brain-enriched guanylate kinase-associated protein isoform X2 [Xenopus tropicalis]|uniref:Brain-enriched guanylate kinase-associated protein isoform X2 n=2 Tax=Xenopus tropicalis TaxID=8364 RepID=A0A8J0STW0_XENTR|nr:brain-enriched guanylate kinase-associated protein isoform X2 [Xenopus tropicalis]|eukprot:XP_012823382.1 PREDICTED: brain-enriched guanylate kinase-associated protein isoform X2 [Xenopus tropicalis]
MEDRHHSLEFPFLKYFYPVETASLKPQKIMAPILRNKASTADMEKISSLQDQKEELQKRLSYTTHKLEMLESEFDSTRQFLETELRRAQEELEKVTEKLRRIQTNYLSLQRINQELEEKLHRMGQHYEEEKRALGHEVIALNNHLLEAKVTIDKLSEDNELYRKDCNLASQLLQCSKSYFRAHKLSELPADFQERVSQHLEKHGCSLSVPLSNTTYADSIPTCVIAKVLEKPDPGSVSSHPSSASMRDLSYEQGGQVPEEKLRQRQQFKSEIYCSDTALYCPEERRRDRRQSFDVQVKDEVFLRSQNSTDSTVEDGFHSSFSHEAFNEYVASLPTSSSYSSFSATSEEKENNQTNTLTASQQAIYMGNREDLFERKSTTGYEHAASPRFVKSKSVQHMEHSPENTASPNFTRSSSYVEEPFHFSRIRTQQTLSAHKSHSECRSSHLSEDDLPTRWRQLSVEDIGAYSYSNAGRISPCSFTEQYFAHSPVKQLESRMSPLYASYKQDSFSEGEEVCQTRMGDSCFLRTDSGLKIDISASCKQEMLSTFKSKETRDQKGERMSVQMSNKSIDSSSSAKREYVDVSPNSSAESLSQSPMEASEMHQSSIEQGHSSFHGKPQQFQRTGSIGLTRKDSLTKAQLYGTLLN